MATETGREWHMWPEKGLRTQETLPDGRWLDLVVTAPDDSIRAFFLPEWLIDAIIADHQQAALLPEALAVLEKMTAYVKEWHPNMDEECMVVTDIREADALIAKLADRTASQQEAGE